MKYYAIFTPRHYCNFIHLGAYCALAQYVLKEPTYAKMLLNRSRYGATILLDNGAAEGEMVGLEDLISAANLCGADEIVLPDAQGDPSRTIFMAEHALEHLPDVNTMFVVHGTSRDEWKDALLWVMRTGYRGSVGLPKYIDNSNGGIGPHRIDLLSIIEGWGIYQRNRIHLLGIHDTPWQAKWYAEAYSWIRSIDTAAPLAFSQNNKYVDESDGPYSLDWDNGVIDPLVLDHNIEEFVEMCNAHNFQTPRKHGPSNALY